MRWDLKKHISLRWSEQKARYSTRIIPITLYSSPMSNQAHSRENDWFFHNRYLFFIPTERPLCLHLLVVHSSFSRDIFWATVSNGYSIFRFHFYVSLWTRWEHKNRSNVLTIKFSGWSRLDLQMRQIYHQKSKQNVNISKNGMTISIKTDFDWYWCGRCGRTCVCVIHHKYFHRLCKVITSSKYCICAWQHKAIINRCIYAWRFSIGLSSPRRIGPQKLWYVKTYDECLMQNLPHYMRSGKERNEKRRRRRRRKEK